MSMEAKALYEIIKDIVSGFASNDPAYQSLPETLVPDSSLNEMGLDITTLPEVISELEGRLGGRDLKLTDVLNPADVNTMTMGDLLNEIKASLNTAKKNPIVVYVDDEEENLFIFTRKYGKRFNLKSFLNPMEALEFIKSHEDVGLVITDEVMPQLSGNQLCDEVHKIKPLMKFILITGNPNSDEDLMYRSLRANRFFDFINKPMDLERKGEEYFNMVQKALLANF